MSDQDILAKIGSWPPGLTDGELAARLNAETVTGPVPDILAVDVEMLCVLHGCWVPVVVLAKSPITSVSADDPAFAAIMAKNAAIAIADSFVQNVAQKRTFDTSQPPVLAALREMLSVLQQAGAVNQATVDAVNGRLAPPAVSWLASVGAPATLLAVDVRRLLDHGSVDPVVVEAKNWSSVVAYVRPQEGNGNVEVGVDFSDAERPGFSVRLTTHGNTVTPEYIATVWAPTQIRNLAQQKLTLASFK